ncbi:MAG: hypothetical protein P8182_12915 [Deltaproteobacteria bacterium]
MRRSADGSSRLSGEMTVTGEEQEFLEVVERGRLREGKRPLKRGHRQVVGLLQAHGAVWSGIE